jgi:trimeric autotransporter adhesin
MNKIYRNVWNAVTGTWVAACETAKGRSKGSTGRRSVVAVAIVASIGAAGLPEIAVGQATLNGGIVTGNISGIAIDGSFNGTCTSNGSNPTGFSGPTRASASDAIAIGCQTSASGLQAVAIGSFSAASAAGSLAIGNAAQSNSINAVALGNGATVGYGASNSIAFGGNANVQGDHSVAVGGGAQALSGSALAFGGNATVNVGATNSVAVGNNATIEANANNATAIGYGALAKSSQGVAVGTNSTAGAANSMAVGSGSNISTGATNSMALGSNSNVATNANNAVAIGYGANALSSQSMTFGTNSTAGAASTIVIGNGASISDTSSTGAVAIGQGTSATGANAIALGYGSVTTRSNAVAIGKNANSSGLASVALGQNASATASNSVALGTGSSTAANLSASAYKPGGALLSGVTPVGEVSIGSASNERRITNVAAGAGNTDAVNVSQLKSLAQDALMWDPLANSGNGAYSAGHVGMGPNTITNVAPAIVNANSTDAVNGSQLYQTNQNVTNLDNRVTNVEGDVTTLGDTLANIAGDTSAAYTTNNGLGVRYVRTNDTGLVPGDASAQAVGSTAVGYDALATGQDSLALGRAAQTMNANDVALGSRSTTETAVATYGATIGGTDYWFAGNSPASTVSVGNAGNERTITNVAAGRLSATSTDAVNGSQLDATNQAVNQISSNVMNPPQGVVKYDTYNDGTVDYTSITLGGPASTDGGKTGGTRITNLAQGAVSATSTDAVNGAQLYETNQQVSQNTTNISNLSNSINNGELGLVRQDPTTRNITVASETDGAVVDLTGTAGARQMRGVANGEISQTSLYAINGSQLYGVSSSIANAFGGGSKVNVDGSISAPSYNIGGRTYNNVGDALTNVDGRVTHIENSMTTISNQINSSETGLVKQDPNTGNVTVAAATGGSVVDVTGTEGARKVTGIADGTVAAGSSDAVNGSQLYALAETISSSTVGSALALSQQSANQTLSQANAYTDQQVGAALQGANAYTDNKVNTVRRNASAGTAAAMAMAALPQAVLPGKGMVALGGSTYDGEAGLALGVSRMSGTGKWVVKGTASTNSRGVYGVAVGTGFHW